MRKSIFVIAILTSAAHARAGVTLTIGESIAVDERQSFTTTYTQLEDNVVGSGPFLIDPHFYSVFYEIRSTGLVSSLTLSGTLGDLRHISANGDNTYTTYERMDDSATFDLSVGLSSATTFTLGGIVAAIAHPGPVVGGGRVGNGIPDYPGGTPLGPNFSFALGGDAVAAANASFVSGNPFVLEISGRGFASITAGGFDPSLEGDLSGLQLNGVAVVPEPSTIIPCGIAGLVGIVYSLRRRNAKLAT